MVPVFPTKTYPNHYTIVTGRYAARHGIVGNVFTTPDIGRRLSLWDPRRWGTHASTWPSRSG
jgi:predicted AlkP superfamily pyrophosphatase or phosphodiesterase